MPEESSTTTPAVLQDLSADVIRLYRGTAAFANRTNAGQYKDAKDEAQKAAKDEAQQEINRLLALAYKVLLRRREFFLFQRAQVQHPQEGWRATCRASWHDQAALEAGGVLWDLLGSSGGRFPPEPGDPAPPFVEFASDLEHLEIWPPDCQWQGYHTWSDEKDGWEARAMEGTLQAEAARAAELCTFESSPRDAADTKTRKPAKKKRSTKSGDAKLKLVSGLTLHHGHENGRCKNPDPIGVNELARKADVSAGAASRFFAEQFGDHVKYRAACLHNPATIAHWLRDLNKENTPSILHNPLPAEN